MYSYYKWMQRLCCEPTDIEVSQQHAIFMLVLINKYSYRKW